MLDEIMGNAVDEPSLPSTGSQESTSIGKSELQQDLTAEALAIVSRARRRGRRKIMKKKTLKDDEGYLGSLTWRLWILLTYVVAANWDIQ